MDKHDAGQQSRNSCLNTWRAGCGGSRTSGSEGGLGKPTSRKADRAPRPDPYTKLRGPATWTSLWRAGYRYSATSDAKPRPSRSRVSLVGTPVSGFHPMAL